MTELELTEIVIDNTDRPPPRRTAPEPEVLRHPVQADATSIMKTEHTLAAKPETEQPLASIETTTITATARTSTKTTTSPTSPTPTSTGTTLSTMTSAAMTSAVVTSAVQALQVASDVITGAVILKPNNLAARTVAVHQTLTGRTASRRLPGVAVLTPASAAETSLSVIAEPNNIHSSNSNVSVGGDKRVNTNLAGAPAGATISDTAGATSEVTSATNDVTGASNDVTGATNDVTGATNDVTGATNDVAGAMSADVTGAKRDVDGTKRGDVDIHHRHTSTLTACARCLDDTIERASTNTTGSVVCRICQLTAAESGKPLVHTGCLCRGSVRACHSGCLRRWIQTRTTNQCEICHHPFQYDCIPMLPFYRDIEWPATPNHIPCQYARRLWFIVACILLLCAVGVGATLSVYTHTDLTNTIAAAASFQAPALHHDTPPNSSGAEQQVPADTDPTRDSSRFQKRSRINGTTSALMLRLEERHYAYSISFGLTVLSVVLSFVLAGVWTLTELSINRREQLFILRVNEYREMHAQIGSYTPSTPPSSQSSMSVGTSMETPDLIGDMSQSERTSEHTNNNHGSQTDESMQHWISTRREETDTRDVIETLPEVARVHNDDSGHRGRRNVRAYRYSTRVVSVVMNTRNGRQVRRVIRVHRSGNIRNIAAVSAERQTDESNVDGLASTVVSSEQGADDDKDSTLDVQLQQPGIVSVRQFDAESYDIQASVCLRNAQSHVRKEDKNERREGASGSCSKVVEPRKRKARRVLEEESPTRQIRRTEHSAKNVVFIGTRKYGEFGELVGGANRDISSHGSTAKYTASNTNGSTQGNAKCRRFNSVRIDGSKQVEENLGKVENTATNAVVGLVEEPTRIGRVVSKLGLNTSLHVAKSNETRIIDDMDPSELSVETYSATLEGHYANCDARIDRVTELVNDNSGLCCSGKRSTLLEGNVVHMRNNAPENVTQLLENDVLDCEQHVEVERAESFPMNSADELCMRPEGNLSGASLPGSVCRNVGSPVDELRSDGYRNNANSFHRSISLGNLATRMRGLTAVDMN